MAYAGDSRIFQFFRYVKETKKDEKQIVTVLNVYVLIIK